MRSFSQAKVRYQGLFLSTGWTITTCIRHCTTYACTHLCMYCAPHPILLYTARQPSITWTLVETVSTWRCYIVGRPVDATVGAFPCYRRAAGAMMSGGHCVQERGAHAVWQELSRHTSWKGELLVTLRFFQNMSFFCMTACAPRSLAYA